jgi:hypothetical protein
VYVYRASTGLEIGAGDVSSPAAGCGVTVQIGSGLSAGDEILVLYREAGPFVVSATTRHVVP